MCDAQVVLRRRTPIGRARLVLLVCLIACVAGGCGAEAPFEISEVRERSSSERPQPARSGATSEERFGGGVSGHGLPPGHGLPAGLDGGHGGSQAAKFTWSVPADWTQLPSRPMREVGFRVGGGEGAECVLSVLTGDGGGLAANVNRWRAQMGQDPLDADAVDQLETTPFLGGSARVVDVAGTYRGMGADHLEDARLLGLIAERPGDVVFLKMTGPGDVVRDAREAMFEFASSVKPREPGRSTDGLASDLAWTAQEGWVKQPDRMMREVTYAPGGEVGAECYVAILSGTAGGVNANLNRWRDQMGQEPLTSEEIAGLPRIPALGHVGVLISIEGDFTGMAGATYADSMLLGCIIERDLDTVFVKFTGPTVIVHAERSRFESFCKSLKEQD